MKKSLSLLLSLVMILTALPLTAVNSFADTSGDYTYTVFDGKATITECDTSISGDVTIPSELGGYPVTSIGDSAFYSCTSLKSITIPNSVTNIGYRAFRDCISLESIAIPNSVISIGDSAFFYCTSLTSITIPDSITSIESFAFYDCTSLTNVTIPDSVTSIERAAFTGCTSLTNVTIPDSVTSIGRSAFSDCTSLTSIIIPNSVTSIGEQAFSSCTSLTSIKIPNSVTSIGEQAFSSCTSLTSITIPNSVTSIERAAFYYCTSLTKITIPDSVTSIGQSAFYGCTSLTSITIGNGVTSIGQSAFVDCTSLANVTIGNSVTSIGRSAFYNCTSLTSITIPNSVTSIGDYAFENCTSLTSITIPNSVTSIERYAFSGCTSLTKITIPDSVTSIGRSAFSDCTSLTSIIIPNSVASIGYMAFDNCTKLQTVYYSGSETDWKSISIDSGNEKLKNANIIFNSYIVYLNANGGECSQSAIVVTDENSASTLPTPTRAKHRFEGWYTQVDGGAKVEEVSISPDNSIQTLYAHWYFSAKAEIIEEPYQTLYYIGDEISLDGIQVKITYYDDSTEFVTADQLSFTGDTSTAGKNKDLVVSYTENGETITATTKITVKKPSARSYCDGLETDEIYLVGSGRFTLETTPSGLPARWESSNKNIISITSDGYYKVTGRGETKITAYFDYNGITYEKDVLINVTGTAKSVTNVQPAQDSYYVGEEFNNKVSFHAVIDDGFGNISEVDVVDHRGPDGDTSTPGEKTITFDYFGVTVSYTYTVGIVIEDSETDVNGDGKLTVVDAKWILQSVANTRKFSSEQKTAADVNGDGKVTVVDAKWILQAIAGMRDLSKK